jgi:hypothetical protein
MCTAVKQGSVLPSQDTAVIIAQLPDKRSADRQVRSQAQAKQISADSVSSIRRQSLDSQTACDQTANESSQDGQTDGDREKTIEKVRAWMIKLVTNLNHEAFKGAWRDQWLKRKMRETVEKIESGSLKDMCRVLLKVELEMNWKALSDEFSKHRTRILDAFRKCSAASDVYRELVFFSHELNPNFLHEGCGLPSEATHEMLKLDESSCCIKVEQENFHASAVNSYDPTSQQGMLDAARAQQGLLSASIVPGKIDVTISEEIESKKSFKDNSPPESSSHLDSTLVWALYRKKEWWPAQVILPTHSQQWPMKPCCCTDTNYVSSKSGCSRAWFESSARHSHSEVFEFPYDWENCAVSRWVRLKTH